VYEQCSIVARFRENCRRGNTAISSLCISVGVDVAVSNIKVANIAKELQNGFPLHCYRTTNYCILLLTINIVSEYVCKFALVMWDANDLFSAQYYTVIFGLSGCTIFFHIIS
jgi:hypothetical protein